MKNKKTEFSYYVNKKSGTIYNVMKDISCTGDKKIWATSTNLCFERNYHYYGRDGGITRFEKNNFLICTSEDCSNDFYNNVISNQKLKNDFTHGKITKNRCGITKEDFFNTVLGGK